MAEDGEDGIEDAARERQDAALEASWEAPGRSWGGLRGSLGSKALSPRTGPAGCAGPVFVFFEEEDLVRIRMVI